MTLNVARILLIVAVMVAGATIGSLALARCQCDVGVRLLIGAAFGALIAMGVVGVVKTI